jgi:hypothetical protein
LFGLSGVLAGYDCRPVGRFAVALVVAVTRQGWDRQDGTRSGHQGQESGDDSPLVRVIGVDRQ